MGFLAISAAKPWTARSSWLLIRASTLASTRSSALCVRATLIALRACMNTCMPSITSQVWLDQWESSKDANQELMRTMVSMTTARTSIMTGNDTARAELVAQYERLFDFLFMPGL
jgi:hypothetical protein